MTTRNMSTIKKYLVTADLDGQSVSAFSLEALGDSDKACDRFLDWFLVRRSAWIDITPEDIDPIKESKIEVKELANTDAEFRYIVDVKAQRLTISFYPVKFII